MNGLPQLFIPGPVRISEETRVAMTRGLMAHRGEAFRALLASTQVMLKRLAGTERPVYVATMSAWGCLEAVVRNLAGRRVLVCCSGAFSDKWMNVVESCGKEGDALRLEWGEVVTPYLLREALEKRAYDLVLLTHCETSTGVLNPVGELAKVMRDYPETLWAVDAVSSFAGMPLSMDEWGVDVLVTGVQKALALPPGCSLMVVSERALMRARQIKDRGFYGDFLEFERNALENMTVSTPSIPHVYALAQKMEEIEREGMTTRFARHEAMAAFAQDWAESRGVGLMAPEGYRAVCLTCFEAPRGVDTSLLVRRLRDEYGVLIDGGYGRWKGTTFRVGHMGIESVETIRPVFQALGDLLRDQSSSLSL